MQQKSVVVSSIINTYDRPFSEVVRIACQFKSSLYLAHEGKKVNAKSIMGVMAFGLEEQMNVDIEAEGSDEDAALGALETLLSR